MYHIISLSPSSPPPHPPSFSQDKTVMRRGRKVSMGARPAGSAANQASRRAPTLSTQFRNSLAVLIERMTACYPHFVRCIKPNETQSPNDFKDSFVETQLRYTGVLEATRIRREGFSWRPTFAEFVRRYRILFFPPSTVGRIQQSAATCKKMLKVCVVDSFLLEPAWRSCLTFTILPPGLAIRQFHGGQDQALSQVLPLRGA